MSRAPTRPPRPSGTYIIRPTPLITRPQRVAIFTQNRAIAFRLQEESRYNLAHIESQIYYSLCFHYPWIRPTDVDIFYRRGLRCFNPRDVARAMGYMSPNIRRRFIMLVRRHTRAQDLKVEMDELMRVAEARLSEALLELEEEEGRTEGVDVPGFEGGRSVEM